jgi:hypothetical protein
MQPFTLNGRPERAGSWPASPQGYAKQDVKISRESNGVYLGRQTDPDFLFTPNDADPRFERFVAIMTLLTRAQHLFWMEDPVHDGRLSIVIDRYAPDYTAEVR